MHEFSVMSQIVESVLREANDRDAIRVEEVVLELGEFTMLGDEQLRFAFDILTKDTILEGAGFTIKPVKGRIRCKCGFEGQMSPSPDSPHRMIPILECPQCKGMAEIVSGRECVVRNIRMVVPDV